MIILKEVRRATWGSVGQFEGMTLEECPVYVRYKWGELTVSVGPAGHSIQDAVNAEPIMRLAHGGRGDFAIDWDEVECLTGLRCVGAIDDQSSKGVVRLRPAVSDDALQVSRLFRRVRTESLPFLPTLHSPEEDYAYFQGQIASAFRAIVAEANEVVAFCIAREAWIDHLYVESCFQGQGIGSKLLGVCLSGLDQARLWVFRRNEPAVRFYERAGWIEVERTDGSRNEEGEPDILMSWKNPNL